MPARDAAACVLVMGLLGAASVAAGALPALPELRLALDAPTREDGAHEEQQRHGSAHEQRDEERPGETEAVVAGEQPAKG